jgi:hypothetical protein
MPEEKVTYPLVFNCFSDEQLRQVTIQVRFVFESLYQLQQVKRQLFITKINKFRNSGNCTSQMSILRDSSNTIDCVTPDSLVSIGVIEQLESFVGR